MKQHGMAAISSSTMDPGSFRASVFSPSPHNHTETKNAATFPAMNHAHECVNNNKKNQASPTAEPAVPGATGTHPAPNPWAMNNFIDPAGRADGSATDRPRRK